MTDTNVYSIDFEGWGMTIISGGWGNANWRTNYRYFHSCISSSSKVTSVFRVCVECKTTMPDHVQDHFRKVQIFTEPPRHTPTPTPLSG